MATSNIHSVWLSADGHHYRHQAATSRDQPIATGAGERYPGQANATGDQGGHAHTSGQPGPQHQLLVASSSSLQPAIVSIEPPTGALEQLGPAASRRQAQRRSSQSIELAPIRFKLAHIGANFSDEPGSLDHLWEGTRAGTYSAAPNASGAPSNAQVQFDEELHQLAGPAAKSGRGRKPDGQANGPRANDEPGQTTGARRQEPDEILSNLAPRHEANPRDNRLDSGLAVPDEHVLRSWNATNSTPHGHRQVPTRFHQDNNNEDNSIGHLDDADEPPSPARANKTTLLHLIPAPLAGYETNRTNSKQHANQIETNYTTTGAIDATDQTPVGGPVRHRPPAIYYYLPNGDRWNSADFGNDNDEQQLADLGHHKRNRPDSHFKFNTLPDQLQASRFTNANVDFRVAHQRRHQGSGLAQLARPLSLDEPLQQHAAGAELEPLRRGSSGQPAAPDERTNVFGDQFRPMKLAHEDTGRADRLSYGFVPQNLDGLDSGGRQLVRPDERHQVHAGGSAPFRQLAPIPALSQNQWRQADQLVVAQAARQRAQNDVQPPAAHYYAGPAPARRALSHGQSSARHQHLIGLGEVAPPLPGLRERQKSSFFARNHNPDHQARPHGSPPRPKKLSLLGALGNKLTGAYNQAQAQAQRDQQELEKYFYEPRQPTGGHRLVLSRKQLGATEWPVLVPAGLNTAGQGSLAYQDQLNTVHTLANTRPLVSYGPIQQPTVAPATSTLSRLYGRHQPPRPAHHQLNQLGSQQPASFIPVVAVQVTRTSPAPLARPLDDQAQLAPEMSNSEIDDYLEAKTGHLERQVGGTDGNKRLRSGSSSSGALDYGSLASGSSTSLAATGGVGRQAPGEHTTTVKSAVFGLLPHQADGPLMQAIGLLPQLQSALAGNQQRGDIYSTQMDRAHQAPLVDQQLDAQFGHEEAPSLALQLQANSVIQNDIAHPFGANNLALQDSVALQSQQPARLFGAPTVRPISVYPSDQAQYHGFQFLAPSASSAGSLLANPLLADSHHQLLMAAASDLSPLYPAQFLFAGPKDPLASESGRPAGASEEQRPAAEAQHQPTTHDETDEPPASASMDQTKSHLNSKGRKRSSEFFANAGQLLLSALPLLLAPTLGLMFASSPHSAARYHAAGPLAAGATQPATYVNSMSEGVVSNASPTQLFTPIPPSYMSSTPTTPAAPGGARAGESGANRTSTSGSKQRPGQGPGRGAGPAPASPKANATRGQTSTSPRPLAAILTTLSPPPYANVSGADSDLGAHFGNKSFALDALGYNQTTNIASPTTILLLSNQNEDENGPERADSLAGHRNGSSQGDVGAGHQYEIGYEGADFDAQFATLLRGPAALGAHADNHEPANTYLASYLPTARPQKYAKDRNRYQYSEVKPAPSGNESVAGVEFEVARRGAQMAKNGTRFGPAAYDESAATTELYPVSTWPQSRRRTVSVVTSSGNRTLLDASDKYLALASQPPQADWQTTGSNVSSSLVAGARELYQLAGPDARALRRRRRDTGADWRHQATPRPAFNETRTPGPKGKRVRLIKRVRLAAGLAANRSAGGLAGRGEPGARRHSLRRADLEERTAANETLRQDSSKSKSAIVTAMITHVADAGDRDDDERDEPDQGFVPEAADQDLGAPDDELREQLLAKKMVLDGIASQAGSLFGKGSRLAHRELAGAEPQLDQYAAGGLEQPDTADVRQNFSAGGRGRFRPAAVGATSARRERDGATMPLETPSGRRQRKNALELAEDTKKALAKFGTLLLEDTLQMPEPRRRKQSRNDKHDYQAAHGDDQYAATERYAVRATRAPADDLDEWPRRQPSGPADDRPVRSSARHHRQDPLPPPSYYQDEPYPGPGRALARDARLAYERANATHYVRVHDGAPSALDDYRNGHAYSAAPPAAERAGASNRSALLGTGDPQSPVVRYNHFLMSHLSNRSVGEQPGTGQAEPMDARHSGYLNYTTTVAPYNEPVHHNHYAGYYDNYAHYSGAGRRETGAPHPHAYPTGALPPPNDMYPPAVAHQHNYTSSYPPAPAHPDPRPPSSHDYHQHAGAYNHQHQDHYAPAPGRDFSRPPAASQQQQHKYDWSSAPMGPQQPLGMLPGARPDYYAHHQQQHHHQQPPRHLNHFSSQPDSWAPNYSSSSASPSPSMPSSPLVGSQQQPMGAGAGQAPMWPAPESRTVNEYLKRVHFSDSDRDKLMAR